LLVVFITKSNLGGNYPYYYDNVIHWNKGVDGNYHVVLDSFLVILIPVTDVVSIIANNSDRWIE
jgi:hypothetical protein